MAELTNAEVAERAMAAFSRGELDLALGDIAEDVEWHVTLMLPDLPPDKTVFRGHDEVRDLWRLLREVWDELSLEPEEVLYDRDDLLIERVRFRGRGSASGVVVDRVVYYVQELSDEKLARIRPFDSADEAFEAAGVERD
jgi:ketosteroid isomerase-like protein